MLRKLTAPISAREIALARLDGETPEAARKQEIDIQAAILAALRKRDGKSAVGEGVPARRKLISP